MPRTVTFDGKAIIEPGAYARVIGGVSQSNFTPDTGTVLLIDTGINQGYGGGAGFDGTNSSGLSSVYEFNSYDDFARWNRGGEVNQIAYRVFNPSPSRSGANKLMFVSAATTTPASLTITLTNGTIVAKTVAEGIGANGVLASGNLETGFAMKIVAGVVNTAKFKIQLFAGVYEGSDANGDPFGSNPSGTPPTLIAESREVSTIEELNDWIARNPTASGYLSQLSTTGSGAIVAGDLTSNAGYQVFTGGTSTYSSQVTTDLIKELSEVDFNFVMVLEHGADNAQSTANVQLLSMLTTSSLDMKFLVVAAGEGSLDFDQANDSSFAAAAFYNHKQVFVWHGAIEKVRPEGGFRKYSSLHGAALYVGLISGLAPQEPATLKELDVDRPFYELSRRQREAALKAGVAHLRDVRNRGWCVNQDINSLQDNDDLVYPSGNSPSGSIMRIIAALNTLIRQDVELEFVGKPVSEANPPTIANYIEGKLGENTGTNGLIVRAFEVSVQYSNGDMYAQYKFVPNGPVERVFITGTILNVSAN